MGVIKVELICIHTVLYVSKDYENFPVVKPELGLVEKGSPVVTEEVTLQLQRGA